MTRSAEEIFHEARGMGTSERSAYLKGACGGDAALRARVEALLSADAQAGEFLRTADGSAPTADSAAEAATISLTPREHRGQEIGRYKLLEQIGEGGFGSVWAAEQREPVRRRVALKIIKLGMDTRQVIARFEAERQALAMMDHPNIAKVLDAGATETGRPFFVMELVKGVPIVEYCDKEKLDTRQRLDLFMKVCHAIQHAHQKGIIHRDIKPSNVLVTLHDGVPVPKVIDFGIAKATNQELTSRTVYTEHRQMIGTPAYMSPEQAEMSGLDIDTRSDIYSLGVLLYEMLTGITPFTHEELASAGFEGMMRMIREVEPHKPSTRLSSLGDTATQTALRRRADVKQLGVILRGDLDWIVMKCLEKDRQRRYETANGLAADIQRHLADEPVVAGPPSAKYRLAKFVKRNKRQVIAGVLVAATLVAGLAGTSLGMAWAIREKQRAVEEAERAERELARATEIKRLITDMLRSVDPAIAQAADTTLLKGILDDASERLGRGEITDELIAAELHHVTGEVYWRLGLLPQAEAHLPKAVEIQRRALGEEHPDTLASMHNLAILHWYQGRYTEAELLHLKVREIRRRVLGEEHPDTLSSVNNLAILSWNQGRYAEAEALFVQTLEIQRRALGEEHRDTLKSIGNLAVLYVAQGRYAEAEPLNLKALEIQRRVLGEEHPETLRLKMGLAELYRNQGRYTEAEPLQVKSLAITRRVLGEEHPITLQAMNNLAVLYRDQSRYAEAEPLNLKALEIQRRVLGEEHPDTLRSMNNLAFLYLNQGRHAEAEPLNLKALEIQRRVMGEENPETLRSMHILAFLYLNQGRYADAEPLYLKALEISRRVLGEEHPETLRSTHNLAFLYMNQGRYAEAEPLNLKALEIARRMLGEEHPETLRSMTNLTVLYLSQDRHAEAEPLFAQMLEIQRRVLGEEHPETLRLMHALAATYFHQDRYAEAEPLFVQTLEIQRRVLGEEHPDTLLLMHSLAALYLNQDRYAEAEPLLLAGYRGMKDREEAIPPQGQVPITEVLERLVYLYDAWHASEPDKGYDAKAAAWKTELEAAKAEQN